MEKIQSAMAAAAVVVKAAGPKPTLLTYLNAIRDDAAQLLSAAGLQDPAAAQRLTSLVGAITAEVDAMVQEINAAVSATA